MQGRRDFLRALAVGACTLLPAGCQRSGREPGRDAKETTMTSTQHTQAEGTKDRMPVLFVGHGSPMNVIEDNRFSRGFAALRELVPRPSAILAVSAHWYVPGTYLTGDVRPRTI